MRQVELSREELYELVWTVPISQLSARLGVSDVGLAKTCVRLSVPRPGRGYWARHRAGNPPKRPALPTPKPRQATSATFRVVDQPPPPRRPGPKGPTVAVPDSLDGAHQAVQALGRALRRAEFDAFERIVVRGTSADVFAATVETHRRALLLLHALCAAAVERGHRPRFGWVKPEDHPARKPNTQAEPVRHGRFAIQVQDESIEVGIDELIERQPYEPTAEELERWGRGVGRPPPKTTPVASGRLCLRLPEGARGRSEWRDRRKSRLDDQLGEVLLALEDIPQWRKERREAAAQEQRRRDAERLAEREAQERRARDERRENDLRAMAAGWAEAQKLRAFVTALEAALPADARTAEFKEWLAWTYRHIDELDPLPALVAKARGPGS